MATFWRVQFFAPRGRKSEFDKYEEVESMIKVTRDYFLPDRHSVRREMQQEGFIPISIENRELAWYEKELFSREYKMRMLQAVAFHVRAGLSAGKALECVIEGEDNTRLRIQLEPALEVLRRGGDFSSAVRVLNMYDNAVVSILEAGERTASLSSAIQSAVTQMQGRNNNWRLLAASFGWIVFDLASVVSTLFAMQYTALPYLEKNGIDSKTPEAIANFKASLDLAYFLNGALLWTSTFIIVAVCLFGLAYAFAPKARLMIERWMVRIPFLGSVFINSSLSISCAIVARMLQGAVRLSDCAEVASSSTTTASVKEFWGFVRARLLSGVSPAQAMNAAPLSRAERIQIRSHQDSRQLADVLLVIADARDYASSRAIRKLIQSVVLGSLLFGAASVILALYVLSVQNQTIMSKLTGG